MFSAPLIYPRQKEMLCENLHEIQTSYVYSPVLCKKLKDMDTQEKSLEGRAENLSKSIEERVDFSNNRRLLLLGASIFSFSTNLFLIHKASAVKSELYLASCTLSSAVTVPIMFKTMNSWSFDIECLNAEAKARGIGKERIKRLITKIHDIQDEIDMQELEKVLSDEEIEQLKKAKGGFEKLYNKYMKIYSEAITNVAALLAGFGGPNNVYVSFGATEKETISQRTNGTIIHITKEKQQYL